MHTPAVRLALVLYPKGIMKYYYINIQVDFNTSREMKPLPNSNKPWKSVGYFQSFFCTEESKDKAKQLVHQYFIENEVEPSNCHIKYDRVAWMRYLTKLDDLKQSAETGLTQEMFDNRNKIGIWYSGEKQYYVSEDDFAAEMISDHYEEYDNIEEELDDEFWGSYEGQCQGCDNYGPVDDLMLCNECSAKLDRDLIRQREWDSSASAYGLSNETREKLRNDVMKKYGKELELIAPTRKNNKNKNKSKHRKKKK